MECLNLNVDQWNYHGLYSRHDKERHLRNGGVITSVIHRHRMNYEDRPSQLVWIIRLIDWTPLEVTLPQGFYLLTYFSRPAHPLPALRNIGFEFGGNESIRRVKIFGMRPDFCEGKLCCPFVRPKIVQVSDCNWRPLHVGLIEHVWYMMPFWPFFLGLFHSSVMGLFTKIFTPT